MYIPPLRGLNFGRHFAGEELLGGFFGGSGGRWVEIRRRRLEMSRRRFSIFTRARRSPKAWHVCVHGGCLIGTVWGAERDG